MPLATWSSPAVEQALVGELWSEALLRLARHSSPSDGLPPKPNRAH
jgi:hypothetical protein